MLETEFLQLKIPYKIKQVKKTIDFWYFYKTFYRKFFFYTTDDQEELKKLFSMRYHVYCEEFNYIDKTKFPDKLEKDEWDEHSVHFIIRDRFNEISATVRLILNSEVGFPIEKHFEFDINLANLNRNVTAEVSRFIVSRKYRRRHLMFVLIKGLYLYFFDKGIKNVFGVMDDRLFPMLKSVGIPFRKIGKPSLYQGYTFPCLLNTDELEDELDRNNKALLKFLSYGTMKYNSGNNQYTLS